MSEHGLEEVMESVENQLDEHQIKALDLMEEIKLLEAQKAVVEDKLNRALRIKFFFPEAYDTGACKVFPRGNANRPDGMQFVIQTGDGVKHVWKLLDVPIELWEKWKPMFRKNCTGMRSPQHWRD
jgi:hypothetical protein